MTIDEAEMKQDEFNAVFGVLSGYSPRGQKYIETKNKFLDKAKKFYEGREKIIEGCKDGMFLLNWDDAVEEQARHQEEEKNMRNENDLLDYKKLETYWLKKKET